MSIQCQDCGTVECDCSVSPKPHVTARYVCITPQELTNLHTELSEKDEQITIARQRASIIESAAHDLLSALCPPRRVHIGHACDKYEVTYTVGSQNPIVRLRDVLNNNEVEKMSSSDEFEKAKTRLARINIGLVAEDISIVFAEIERLKSKRTWVDEQKDNPDVGHAYLVEQLNEAQRERDEFRTQALNLIVERNACLADKLIAEQERDDARRERDAQKILFEESQKYLKEARDQLEQWKNEADARLTDAENISKSLINEGSKLSIFNEVVEAVIAYRCLQNEPAATNVDIENAMNDLDAKIIEYDKKVRVQNKPGM